MQDIRAENSLSLVIMPFLTKELAWIHIGHIIVGNLFTVSLSMSKTFIPGPLLSIILVTYCLTAKVTFILSTVSPPVSV